jgi:hypothetical protein
MAADSVFQGGLLMVQVVEQDAFGREGLDSRGIVRDARPTFTANHGFGLFDRGANPLYGLRYDCGFVHQFPLHWVVFSAVSPDRIVPENGAKLLPTTTQEQQKPPPRPELPKSLFSRQFSGRLQKWKMLKKGRHDGQG